MYVPSETMSKSAMPLPLGHLEHLISECPLPNTAVILEEIQTTERERPCIGSLINRPAGHSLQGTTPRKPDL